MFIPETEIIITRDGAELTRVTVKPGDYVIGCGNGADIVVQADDVAERHAMLTVNYHELFIEDLGSGGTSVARPRPPANASTPTSCPCTNWGSRRRTTSSTRRSSCRE